MRTLVAANWPLVARGVAVALAESHPDWPVRFARSAQECLSTVDSWSPDLVLVDVDLPRAVSLSLLRDLARRPTRTVLVADETDRAVAALEHGVQAVVAEEEGLAGLLTAVDSVHRGRAYISSVMLREVIDRLVADAATHRQRPAPEQGLERLSERERAVLGLLRAGLDRNAIAEELGIAPQTAKTHLRHVLQKLGVHSRQEAAAIAADHEIPAPRRARGHDPASAGTPVDDYPTDSVAQMGGHPLN